MASPACAFVLIVSYFLIFTAIGAEKRVNKNEMAETQLTARRELGNDGKMLEAREQQN